MSENKQVKFDELYMAIFDLDSTTRTKREYSEKDKCYVVKKSDLQNAFNKLKQLLED